MVLNLILCVCVDYSSLSDLRFSVVFCSSYMLFSSFLTLFHTCLLAFVCSDIICSLCCCFYLFFFFVTRFARFSFPSFLMWLVADVGFFLLMLLCMWFFLCFALCRSLLKLRDFYSFMSWFLFHFHLFSCFRMFIFLMYVCVDFSVSLCGFLMRATLFLFFYFICLVLLVLLFFLFHCFVYV